MTSTWVTGFGRSFQLVDYLYLHDTSTKACIDKNIFTLINGSFWSKQL
jgi:hypothetical protein